MNDNAKSISSDKKTSYIEKIKSSWCVFACDATNKNYVLKAQCTSELAAQAAQKLLDMKV